jgi:hypothetical protein
MALKWADRQQLSRQDLIERYDFASIHVEIESLDFIRDEIFQRDLAAQGDRMEAMTRNMERLTNRIHWLTIAITLLTAASTVGTIVLLVKD